VRNSEEEDATRDDGTYETAKEDRGKEKRSPKNPKGLEAKR
jgi:hypothetical protein